MKAIGSVLKVPLKALGLIPKMPKAPAPTAPITRDSARDAANAEDALFGRRGGAADQVVNGTGGAEAGATSKTLLG
jgi:hypothetical protein